MVDRHREKMNQTESLIKNPARASQVIDFTGILDGAIAPTDIDGVIEWKNMAYIFIEVKYQDKQMPLGQRLAIERLVDDAVKCGKQAYAILVRHNISNIYESVMLNDQMVYAIYWNHHWFPPNPPCTAGDFIRRAIDYFKKGHPYVGNN